MVRYVGNIFLEKNILKSLIGTLKTVDLLARSLIKNFLQYYLIKNYHA